MTRKSASVELAGERRHSRTVARNRFLELVRQSEPDVLRSLRYAEDTTQSLKAWAQRWNLSAPWIIERAESTLALWRRFPSLIGDWAPARPLAYVVPRPPSIVIGPGYEPTSESRATAKARLERGFAEELKKHLDQREQELLKRGFVRRNDNPRLEDHLTWLVRFQVSGWSPSRIRRQFPAVSTELAITSGLRSAGRLIELVVRAPRRGPARRRQ